MRYPDRPDLGLIVADSFHSGAAAFTRNLCKAAPVIWSQSRFPAGRAILANAGQANAQTGRDGLRDAEASAEALSGLLGIQKDEVLLASTGVIGQPLAMGRLLGALPGLVSGLREDGLKDFSRAILTTDTGPKVREATLSLGGVPSSLWGCAKGAGMLAPSMATMLCFVLCDLRVEGGLLQGILGDAAELTLNRLTVDGDTSTNDSVFLICSGAAGGPEIRYGLSPEAHALREALVGLLGKLARDLTRDGEGATKLVTLTVRGARDENEARLAARTVAESPLVKTAFYGVDPNWGRILAALGRSGAQFDPYGVDIFLNDVPWVKDGVDNGREAEAKAVMALREYSLTICLPGGEGSYTVLTSDLSHDYVTINASYRS
jgi:glutamate N-acetyltransferase/amino-acid N-acetyltransferase